jgi:hypothetical protein
MLVVATAVLCLSCGQNFSPAHLPDSFLFLAIPSARGAGAAPLPRVFSAGIAGFWTLISFSLDRSSPAKSRRFETMPSSRSCRRAIFQRTHSRSSAAHRSCTVSLSLVRVLGEIYCDSWHSDDVRFKGATRVPAKNNALNVAEYQKLDIMHCSKIHLSMAEMGHQLPLAAGIERFRYTPISGPHLKR